jgi:hypothetical protein
MGDSVLRKIPDKHALSDYERAKEGVYYKYLLHNFSHR